MKNLTELAGSDKVRLFKDNQIINPIVSVVVTTYNHEKYISECLESILSQKTNFKYEIIIGEDNSNDQTREICIKYAKKFPDRISLYLHDRENVIKFDNVPTGRYNQIYSLLASKGKYIAFCEGDDYWNDIYKLQKQYEFMENAGNNYTGVCHSTYKLYNKTLTLWRKIDYQEISCEDFLTSTYTIFHTSSIFFRKNVLDIPDEMLKVASGDIFLFILILKNGNIGILNDIMSVYRKHESGLTETKIHKKNFIKNRINYLNIINSYFDYRYDEIINGTKKNLELELKRNKRLNIKKKVKSLLGFLFVKE